MSIEAMKQALKFCEEIGDLRGPYPFVNETSIVSDSRKVLTALRQAIAEAEMVEKGTKAWADTPDDWVDDLRGGAEPVGHVSESGKGAYLLADVGLEDDTPLYAAPREWVGLHEHELQILDFNDPERGKLARAVEAKLKERNR
jgi:hypothetical protein